VDRPGDRSRRARLRRIAERAEALTGRGAPDNPLVDQGISFANFDSFARTGKLDECRAFLDAVYGASGASADYLYAKASLHSRLSQFHEVLEVGAQIDREHPTYLTHRYLMGAAAVHVGDIRPVLCLLHKTQSYPRWQDIQHRAEMLHLIGWDDAVIALAQDFDEEDHHATVARMMRGQSLMRRYGIAAGLSEYARSWTTPRSYALVYRFEPARFRDYWYGELGLPPTIRYTTARGGYGDYFMWQRYLPHLHAAGVKVEVFDDSAPTLAMASIGEATTARARVLLGTDVAAREGQTSWWTEPFTLFTGLFPLLGYAEQPGGTLQPGGAPEADAMLQDIRARAGDRPCMGISWSANESDSTMFGGRSLTLAQILPLLARTDIHWVVFQRGLQRDAWLAHEACGASTTLDPALSWQQTAALIAGLDAVVTIDTALPHLAAGMGRPTFMLLSAVSDWRWESWRSSTPWYAAMRLVRQPVLGDWAGAVGRLQTALSGWMRSDRIDVVQ
jgi:hypothetical protein